VLNGKYLTPARYYFLAMIASFIGGNSDAYSLPLQMTIKNEKSVRKVEITNRSSFVRSIAGTFAAVGFSSLHGSSANAASPLPTTGQRAPDFTMANSKGEGTTSLGDLTKEGKWTVLYFYPGAFTSGCTLEARNFQRDITKYRSLNAQIVGVSVDAVEKNASFCTSEGLDFYMLSDNKGQVSKIYGSALSVPGFGTFSNRQTYLIDPNGDLKWVFTDVESRVTRHSEEVIEKLTELKKA